jgi:uncharacterized protein (DUF302 family)
MADFVSDGLITLGSRHSVGDLMNHLVESVESKGLAVFARIDHAARARSAGLDLRPTELLVFGNTLIEAELMQEQQEIGLDLPMRALVWEDRSDEVWLTFDDGSWLARRHRLGVEHDSVIKAIETLMATVCKAAAET